jgi:hypothetical protein
MYNQTQMPVDLTGNLDLSKINLSIYREIGTPDGIINNGESTILNTLLTNPPYLICNNIVIDGSFLKVRLSKSIISPGTTAPPIDLIVKLTNTESSFNCFSTQQRLRFAVLPLPVTLKNIFVNLKDSKGLLNWTTSTEQNNKGFEVQKSVGNGQDFRTIGFVGTRAKDGNSNTEISYSFEDADIKAGTMHYYRLKQVDFDGKFTYSAIKSIKPGSIESNLSVYPNPSQGSFTLTTGAASGKVNVFLLDNTGRVINQYMNVSSSNTKFNNLKKGFYTLKIVDVETGEQSAQRVVVQ